MRRIAIDTNIYTSFKVNDQSVVETFRDCDLIGVDITVIAELFSGFSLGAAHSHERHLDSRQCMKHGLALYSFGNHFEEIEGLLLLPAIRNGA